MAHLAVHLPAFARSSFVLGPAYMSSYMLDTVFQWHLSPQSTSCSRPSVSRRATENKHWAGVPRVSLDGYTVTQKRGARGVSLHSRLWWPGVRWQSAHDNVDSRQCREDSCRVLTFVPVANLRLHARADGVVSPSSDLAAHSCVKGNGVWRLMCEEFGRQCQQDVRSSIEGAGKLSG
jgi:hypothetical protein